MQMRIDRTAPPKRKKPSKLIAGLAAFLATGIITASGMAGATPGNGNGNGNGNTPNNNHSHSQTAHNNQGGTINHGYGGGNTSIINNINLNINGNGNVVHIIIQILNR